MKVWARRVEKWWRLGGDGVGGRLVVVAQLAGGYSGGDGEVGAIYSMYI